MIQYNLKHIKDNIMLLKRERKKDLVHKFNVS